MRVLRLSRQVKSIDSLQINQFDLIQGEKYDGPTSDVWSCGIILYALLTGNLPFDDENIRKLLNKVKTGLYIIPEHVSASPKDLLQKMLTVDPAQRPSLREVMAHPWFNSKEPKHAIKLAPSPFETDAIEQGYPESYEFETDLLDALKLLGWTNNEQLIANLRAKKYVAFTIYRESPFLIQSTNAFYSFLKNHIEITLKRSFTTCFTNANGKC